MVLNETNMGRKLEQFADFEKPFAIMSVGIPGSGKSTVMHEVASRLGIPVLSSDGIREEITGDPADISQDSQIPAILDAKAGAILAAGESLIIDATHTNYEARRIQAQKCRDLGASAVVGFLIDVPFEIAAGRNESRDRKVPTFVLVNKAAELARNPVSVGDGFERVIKYSEWGFSLEDDNTAMTDWPE